MNTQPFTLEIDADISPLKASLSQADTMFRELDRAVNQHAQSIAAAMSRAVGGSGRRANALEQLAAPLLNQAVSGIMGQVGRQSANALPVQIAMHISTPDANSFRMSQGQILAEAASAISRATRRFL